jgi:hypothetical protein
MNLYRVMLETKTSTSVYLVRAKTGILAMETIKKNWGQPCDAAKVIEKVSC